MTRYEYEGLRNKIIVFGLLCIVVPLFTGSVAIAIIRIVVYFGGEDAFPIALVPLGLMVFFLWRFWYSLLRPTAHTEYDYYYHPEDDSK